MPFIAPIAAFLGRYGVTILGTLGFTKITDYFSTDEGKSNAGLFTILGLVTGALITYFIVRKK